MFPYNHVKYSDVKIKEEIRDNDSNQHNLNYEDHLSNLSFKSHKNCRINNDSHRGSYISIVQNEGKFKTYNVYSLENFAPSILRGTSTGYVSSLSGIIPGKKFSTVW